MSRSSAWRREIVHDAGQRRSRSGRFASGPHSPSSLNRGRQLNPSTELQHTTIHVHHTPPGKPAVLELQHKPTRRHRQHHRPTSSPRHRGQHPTLTPLQTKPMSKLHAVCIRSLARLSPSSYDQQRYRDANFDDAAIARPVRWTLPELAQRDHAVDARRDPPGWAQVPYTGSTTATTSGRVAEPRGKPLRASQRRIHHRARMELISNVAATSVYLPAPVALDVCVEDSHLVGLFVRRCARCGRGKARASLDPLRTAQPRSPRLLERRVPASRFAY
jgi:hypothetical protein